MAKDVFRKIDRTVDRVGYWAGTWKLLSENWALISSIFISFGATIFAAIWTAWRYMQMIASNVSVWFYPFFAMLLLLAIIGAVTSALLIRRFFSGETALGASREIKHLDDWINDGTEVSINGETDHTKTTEPTTAWFLKLDRFSNALNSVTRDQIKDSMDEIRESISPIWVDPELSQHRSLFISGCELYLNNGVRTVNRGKMTVTREIIGLDLLSQIEVPLRKLKRRLQELQAR
ncbi:MAG: hypothetical protein ACRCU5_15675 [Rhizobiaceae bacterium]